MTDRSRSFVVPGSGFAVAALVAAALSGPQIKAPVAQAAPVAVHPAGETAKTASDVQVGSLHANKISPASAMDDGDGDVRHHWP